MSDQANVKSSYAIQAIRAALLQFAKQGEEGLTEITLEIRRLIDWLEHDRPRFWKEQVRLAYDGVQQAKADLHRCLMYPVGVNDRPSCSEERAALKKAEAKLRYCQEKQEKLRHWIREIHHEVHTYEGRTTRLGEVIGTDVPNAAAALGRALAAIDEYTGLASPGARSSSAGSSSATDESGDSGTNLSGGDESPGEPPAPEEPVP